jgi:hypothetical protein
MQLSPKGIKCPALHAGATIAAWRKAEYQNLPEHEAFRNLLAQPVADAAAARATRCPTPRLVGTPICSRPAHGSPGPHTRQVCLASTSVYRFLRRALTLCRNSVWAFNLAPAFPHGALTLCPQLCMGISSRRYTETGLLPDTSSAAF